MARFSPSPGIRGGSPFAPNNPSMSDRGGQGFEQNNTGMESSALPGNVHSSLGFRRAIKRATRTPSRLRDMTNKSNFGGPGFAKPNYFAQGGRRRGLHIGAGAPAVTPARMNGGGFTTS